MRRRLGLVDQFLTFMQCLHLMLFTTGGLLLRKCWRRVRFHISPWKMFLRTWEVQKVGKCCYCMWGRKCCMGKCARFGKRKGRWECWTEGGFFQRRLVPLALWTVHEHRLAWMVEIEGLKGSKSGIPMCFRFYWLCDWSCWWSTYVSRAYNVFGLDTSSRKVLKRWNEKQCVLEGSWWRHEEYERGNEAMFVRHWESWLYTLKFNSLHHPVKNFERLETWKS